MEARHPVTERPAHPSDLPVEPFCEDDAKPIAPYAGRLTPLRLFSEYLYAAGHLVQKRLAEWTVDLYEILPLVAELGAKNLVDNVAVVRHEDETGRVLVQPSDWENPLGMPDFLDDIPVDMRLARRRDTDRLMIFDIDGRLAPGNHPAVAGDDIGGAHPVAHLCRMPVDRDCSQFDQAVRLAPRADPMLRKKLVDANCSGHGARTLRFDS